MRRSVALSAGLILAVGLVWAAFEAERRARARHPVFLLGAGPRIRVDALTWGTNQHVLLEPALWTRVKERLPVSWRARVGLPQHPRQLLGQEGPYLWLSSMDRVTGAYVPNQVMSAMHIDSGGREFRSTTTYAFGPGKSAEARKFDVIDWRVPQLKFRFEARGATQEVILPNPRRNEVFPVWTPQPLPQTRSNAAFRITLKEVVRQHWRGAGWSPKFSVHQGEREVTDWFETQVMFTDPTGNRHSQWLPASEPVWRLELLAYPSARYPIPEERILRLGKVALPKPGEYRVFPTTQASTNAGLRWACITGPGQFSFRNGTNRWARVLGDGSTGNSSRLDGNEWDFTIDQDHGQIQLVVQAPAPGAWSLPAQDLGLTRTRIRLRRADGSMMSTIDAGSSVSDDGTRAVCLKSYLWQTVPAGEVVEVECFVAEPIEASFIFAAPSSDPAPAP